MKGRQGVGEHVFKVFNVLLTSKTIAERQELDAVRVLAGRVDLRERVANFAPVTWSDHTRCFLAIP